MFRFMEGGKFIMCGGLHIDAHVMTIRYDESTWELYICSCEAVKRSRIK